MRLSVYHIYLGESREHAWCGLNVGFHAPLYAVTEVEYEHRKQQRATGRICGNCKRSLEAHKPEGARRA